MVLEKAYAQRFPEIHAIDSRGEVGPRVLEGMVTKETVYQENVHLSAANLRLTAENEKLRTALERVQGAKAMTNPRHDGFSFSLATMMAYLAAQAAMFVPFIILALLILWLI